MRGNREGKNPKPYGNLPFPSAFQATITYDSKRIAFCKKTIRATESRPAMAGLEIRLRRSLNLGLLAQSGQMLFELLNPDHAVQLVFGFRKGRFFIGTGVFDEENMITHASFERRL